MKYLFALILLAFSFKTFAQDNNDKLFVQQQLAKYKRIKTTGTVLTIAGGVLAIVGIANLSSAEYHYDPYTGQRTTTDPKATSGALMFLGGTGLLGAGIPLTIVGSVKSKKLQRKLDGLTFNFKMTPQQRGLTLAYRF
jgi:hypothetical protein